MTKQRLLTLKTGMVLFVLVTLLNSTHSVFSQSRSYPDDPNTDRPYVNGDSFYNRPVSDLEANFNAARAHEESELSITLPDLTMPSQAVWDSWDSNAQALFLINDERVARGLLPLTGAHATTTQIAQDFANFLGQNDAWGHDQDVDNDNQLESPWDRLHTDPTINACHDFLGVSENLAVLVSSSSSFPQDEAVAKAIYDWLYDDSLSLWGHRHALLWSSFNNNSGSVNDEGLFGIGYWSGGPYQGPFSSSWDQAEMIVFNVFDPCSSWDFGVATSVQITQATSSTTHKLPLFILVLLLLASGTIRYSLPNRPLAGSGS